MAQTPEGKVKIKIDKWIKDNMFGCFKYKPPGGFFGQSGIADYILVYKGKPIMIEVKSDITKSLTEIQKKRLLEFKAAGGISCALYGFQEHKLNVIKRQCENIS